MPKRADVRMESLTELKTVATKLNPAVGYWDPLKLAEVRTGRMLTRGEAVTDCDAQGSRGDFGGKN